MGFIGYDHWRRLKWEQEDRLERDGEAFAHLQEQVTKLNEQLEGTMNSIMTEAGQKTTEARKRWW